MLFQFLSVLLLIGSDAAATEVVNRKRSNLLQHKSTNTNQKHDERYAAYMGLAKEDNIIINRQLQNSMSMSMPIEVDKVNKDMHKYAYYVVSNDDKCKDLVLTKPYISDVEYEVPVLTDITNASCEALVACLIDKSSPECAAVSGQDAKMATASIHVFDIYNNVYECDDTNPAHNEETCNLLYPTDCNESSIFPGCYFRWISSNIVDDALNSKCEVEVEEETEEEDRKLEEAVEVASVDDYAYLTYSSDDKCTELSIALPVLSDVPFQMPMLMDSNAQCDALVSCYIDPDSRDCIEVGGTDIEMVNNIVTVKDDGVYECDDSNEANNEAKCELKKPTDCFASSALPGCYARYITLAKMDDALNSNCGVTSWTEEEVDGPQHSDVMWNDKNEVDWKEDVDSGSADVIDDTSSGYIRLSYVSLCVVGLATLLI